MIKVWEKWKFNFRVLIKIKAICRFIFVGALLYASNRASADMMTSDLYPYELSFISATIIVRGAITSYSANEGATLYVKDVLRGNLSNLRSYQLKGSENYSFFSSLPDNVVAFIKEQNLQSLTLWQAPTNGGLIWADHELYDILTRAYAAPEKALKSHNRRERLAAAYYLTTNEITLKNLLNTDLNTIIDDVIWGISQPLANTNQAAIDILDALDISLESIGISYNPYFKDEYKTRASIQLRTWWDNRVYKN